MSLFPTFPCAPNAMVSKALGAERNAHACGRPFPSVQPSSCLTNKPDKRTYFHPKTWRVFPLVPFNAAECSGWMRMKVTHCLSPDLSGRVCGTAADNRAARVAEGQVEGAFSFASFCGIRLENITLGKERKGRVNNLYIKIKCSSLTLFPPLPARPPPLPQGSAC